MNIPKLLLNKILLFYKYASNNFPNLRINKE